MGGNGIYLPSVVRPYQSSIKSKKDSFPYGCCPFSYALLLFISGFETFYNLEPSLGWIESPLNGNTFTRWCQLLHSPPVVTADTLRLQNQACPPCTLYPVFIKFAVFNIRSSTRTCLLPKDCPNAPYKSY